jgi:hypothetical protein
MAFKRSLYLVSIPVYQNDGPQIEDGKFTHYVLLGRLGAPSLDVDERPGCSDVRAE